MVRHVGIMCDALTEGEICWSSLDLDSSMTEGNEEGGNALQTGTGLETG